MSVIYEHWRQLACDRGRSLVWRWSGLYVSASRWTLFSQTLALMRGTEMPERTGTPTSPANQAAMRCRGSELHDDCAWHDRPFGRCLYPRPWLVFVACSSQAEAGGAIRFHL